MKKVFIAIAILFSISVKAQNYNDSVISLQLTQRAAVYVGFYVKTNTVNIWANRLAPTSLKPYINNGTNLDSLFTVVLKADYVKGLVEVLLSNSNEVTQADRLSIINNSPSIPGYTSLATQVTTLAAGNGIYKQVAQYILDYYNQRVLDFANIRTQNIQAIVTWSKN